MDRFVFLTVDGLSRGAVYAAFALALVLIWRAPAIVNFAQGAMAVAAAYVAYSVTQATGSYWLGFVAALVGGLLLGALVERVVMRFVDHASPLNAVIVALGLVLVIQARARHDLRQRVPARPRRRSAATRSTVGGVAAAVARTTCSSSPRSLRGGARRWRCCSRGPPTGLRMRAAAFAPEVSRLLGRATSAGC